jgi:hypothetical protein
MARATPARAGSSIADRQLTWSQQPGVDIVYIAAKADQGYCQYIGNQASPFSFSAPSCKVRGQVNSVGDALSCSREHQHL